MSDQERENCHSSVEQGPKSGHGTVATETVYETMFDAVEDAVFLFDVERDGDALSFTFRRNNPAHEASSGMTVAEFGGQTPREIFGAEEGSEVVAHYRDCVERRETIEYEETLDHPSGTVEWHTKLTPVIEDGDVTKLVGVARDITEQKERERELNQSRERLRALFDDAPDGLTVHDADGNVLDVNDTLTEMLGYTREELHSMTVSDFEVGIDEETLSRRWSSMEFGAMQKMEIEGTHRRKDGSTYPVEVWVSKVTTSITTDGDADETTQAQFIALSRDITERKNYARELEAREEKYRSLFSESRDALMLLDRDEFIECNQAAVDLFGVDSPAAFSENGPWEFSPPTQPDGRASRKAAKVYMEEAFENGSAFFEWTHERADGTAFTAEVKLSRFEIGGDLLLHALIRDITERRQREIHLEKAQEVGNIGWWRTDIPSDEIYWSEQIYDMWGAKGDGGVTDHETFLEFIHPDDREYVDQEWEAAMDGDPYDVEHRIVTGDGEVRWMREKADISFDENGTPRSAVGIVQDITRRKEREQTLERYRTFVENTNDVLTVIDPDGTIEFVSPAVERALGWTPEELAGENSFEYVHPDERDRLLADLEQLTDSDGNETVLEFRFQCGNGGYCWVESTARNLLDNPDIEGILLSTREITERKKQARELRRYKRFIESSSDITSVVEPDGTIRYESPVVRDVLGYEPEDLVGENAFEYIHPEDVDETVQSFARGIEENPDEVHKHELRFLDAEGEWRWMELRASVELDNPAIEGVLINNTDITERKRAEQALQDERDTFADGPVVVFQWQNEPEWPVEYVSENVEDVFGYTPEQLLSGELQYAELIHEDDLERVKREVREHSDAERFSHEPYRIVTSDGTVKWVMDHTKVVREDGEITHRLGYLVDSTQRRQYEQQLAALHGATRAFIDAESKQEIASIAVSAASESLEFTFPAVWFPTEDGSALELTATTPEGQQLLDEAGTPSPSHPRGDWLWEVFESGETVVRSPMPPEDVAADIPIQSAIALPLGDHGVLVCAGEGEADFGDQDVRLAETLARNVQVALDQHEHRAALERQQQFTDDLLDAIDDVGYVLDRHGNLREWNASLESVTGYTSEEIASMNARDFFAEADSATVEQAVREAFETGHARMELDLLAADGEAIPYEFTANVFESPSGERVMAGIGRNRTRHVEYEQELEAERDFLDTVIESVPFPFYVLNVDDYTIEYANSRAVVREGETCYGMTHDRDQPCDQGEDPIACPIAEIRELREPTVVEHTHHDENGKERCFQVHAAPIFDDEGEVAQIAESNIDITDRIEYERRLETQRDNLELLNQVVRHDIRNDLQLIQTYSELLEADIDEDRRQYVETVLESAENAVDLTTTARELAEVMLQSDSDTYPVSLGRTLEQQVEEVRSGHSEAVVTVDGSLPRTTVGANDMLGSVFRNLLKNAIQHNDKTVPEVTVSAVEHDGYVEVRVADNGPGVPDSQKQEIFGKGEKGLESEGTGIGLYLVQSLVDGYGGNVWVEDRVKDGDPDEDTEGAVFVVQLPIVE